MTSRETAAETTRTPQRRFPLGVPMALIAAVALPETERGERIPTARLKSAKSPPRPPAPKFYIQKTHLHLPRMIYYASILIIELHVGIPANQRLTQYVIVGFELESVDGAMSSASGFPGTR